MTHNISLSLQFGVHAQVSYNLVDPLSINQLSLKRSHKLHWTAAILMAAWCKGILALELLLDPSFTRIHCTNYWFEVTLLRVNPGGFCSHLDGGVCLGLVLAYIFS